MAKKTPESKEEAAARRQRELAALTSGVAAFSLMGESPRPAAPAPVEAPPVASAPVPAPTLAAAPARARETPQPRKPATVPTAAQPTKEAAPVAKKVGEKPAPASVAAPAAEQQRDQEPDELDEFDDQDEAVALAPAPASGELDLTQLFIPSAEKKGTTLRITADHQQYFTQLGFILGGGTSAPDIIHNILNRFRAEHEAQIHKALKKQMRQMMAPKK